MKCNDCGDEVDKVDSHGDCVSCQQKAELDEPAVAGNDGHWVKTAAMVQCGKCKEYADESEIDATGECSTCQEQQDTAEQREVENLNY